MSGLKDLLAQDCIALDVPAATWEDAVLAAGGLLERAGVAGPAYTGSMIDNVEANGPYIVVAPGFAFAHARPSPAVHRTGMSWVRLDEPVAFGHPTNDPRSIWWWRWPRPMTAHMPPRWRSWPKSLAVRTNELP